MLSVTYKRFTLSVIMLSVTCKPFTLSLIMLSVIMLSVVAPSKYLYGQPPCPKKKKTERRTR